MLLRLLFNLFHLILWFHLVDILLLRHFNLLILPLDFSLLEYIDSIDELLLPHVQIPLDGALRVHILDLPLPFQMHLPLLMAVILIVLRAHEEVVLTDWHGVRNHALASGNCNHRLWSLKHVLFNFLFCLLVVALPIFAHVVGVEE